MSEILVRACLTGDADALRAALRRGADPNRRYRRRTLLNWAAQEGRDTVVAVLLVGGADPNRADSDIRVRPLHTAAGAGHARIVRRLLSAGANPNVRVKGMGTALHLAACHGHLQCARALVRAGADAGLRDAEGKSAIEYAQEFSRTEVVRFLKEVKGA